MSYIQNVISTLRRYFNVMSMLTWGHVHAAMFNEQLSLR